MSSLPIYIVVTPFFPSSESWRGAYCYDFVVALQKTGRYDVRVFVPGTGEDYEYRGVKVYRFKEIMLPSAVLPFLFMHFNQHSFIKKLDSLKIKMDEIAVCHAHTAFKSIYPLALKKYNSQSLALLHHHDLASFGLNQGKLRHFYPHKLINFFCLRALHNQVDCHVFISKAVENSFYSIPNASWTIYEDYKKQMRGLSYFDGPVRKKSMILHNGVNTSIFHPYSNKKQGFMIGCIGNFDYIKSQITIIESLKYLIKDFPLIKLKFIGSGECLNKCQTFVAEHQLEQYVTFEKEYEHEKLPEFLNSLDLFVLPSFFEGFGCVFTEAYACGVPFMTCEGQGMDDMIPLNERKLWLIRPFDSESLSANIKYFFQHRPVQHLSSAIDIDILVNQFVNQLTEK